MTDQNPPQWAIDAACALVSAGLDNGTLDVDAANRCLLKSASIIARHAPSSDNVLATVSQVIEQVRAMTTLGLDPEADSYRAGINDSLDNLKRRLDELFPSS